MWYVFAIYIFYPTNFNLTDKYFSLTIPAMKLLSKLIAAAISFSCICINCFAVLVQMLAENHSIS